MGVTGIIRHPIYLEHRTGIAHPESPQRLQAVYSMLDARDFGERMIRIEPRYATLEEVLRVHDPRYVDRVLASAEKPHGRFDPDTVTSPKTYQAALMAAGGVMEAINKVMKGEVRNAFALVRPPGHHALRDQAMGFCIFNNESIAAHYAMEALGARRVLIIDWDFHHGNGIQTMFYDSPAVLYFSAHRAPVFPWSGAMTEVGVGAGEGYTVNIPLEAGSIDADYGNIFRHLLGPIARQFRPDVIMVSAGFDAHHSDPLGSMQVTEEGFARMTALVLELADSLCEGRVILALEGGYNPEGLRDSVEMVLRELSGGSRISREEMQQRENEHYKRIAETIEQVQEIQSPYWDF
jgi:acetoin utilization deacetylase AcuC-like enzyme